jgi:hypothetical protein
MSATPVIFVNLTPVLRHIRAIKRISAILTGVKLITSAQSIPVTVIRVKMILAGQTHVTLIPVMGTSVKRTTGALTGISAGMQT